MRQSSAGVAKKKGSEFSNLEEIVTSSLRAVLLGTSTICSFFGVNQQAEQQPLDLIPSSCRKYLKEFKRNLQ